MIACLEVRARLVALDDGELGASEAALVTRHLEACLPCRGQRIRLQQATPRPRFAIPPRVRARLDALEAGAILDDPRHR